MTYMWYRLFPTMHTSTWITDIKVKKSQTHFTTGLNIYFSYLQMHVYSAELASTAVIFLKAKLLSIKWLLSWKKISNLGHHFIEEKVRYPQEISKEISSFNFSSQGQSKAERLFIDLSTTKK